MHVWEALDAAITEHGKNRGQVVAHWEFPSVAAFYDRKVKTGFCH
jgi:hypothetical protein